MIEDIDAHAKDADRDDAVILIAEESAVDSLHRFYKKIGKALNGTFDAVMILTVPVFLITVLCWTAYFVFYVCVGWKIPADAGFLHEVGGGALVWLGVGAFLTVLCGIFYGIPRLVAYHIDRLRKQRKRDEDWANDYTE